MSRVGRTTLLVVAGMLVVFVFATYAMLSTLDRQFRPECLDVVADAPRAKFAHIAEEAGEDGIATIRYDLFPTLPVTMRPQRIVSTLPGITEMVAHLGAADRLVGVSPWCDMPAGAVNPARITVQPFDPEAMLAAKPDLVIIDRRLHRRDLAVIRKRAPYVLMLETSRSLPELVHSMKLLADVLGGAQAQAAAAAFRTRYEGLLAGIDPVWEDGPPRVLVLGGWDPLYAMGRGSLLDDLLRICGCSNVACDLRTDASGPFSEELILARRPAWILVTSPEPMPARLQARWKNLPAVRDGQVAPAWADDVVRGGPRILDALERLHAVLRASKPPAYLGAMK